MQFSETWLRTFVDPALDSAQLAHLLTMAGLEVEALQNVAPPFSGVVVAQVVSVATHPNADKLKLCRVDVGQAEPLQIVCGAPNVVVGMKAPCALVDAELPGVSIKALPVRGIESFGMLCSARELGLSEEGGAAGLLALPADAPVGANIREYLALEDKLFTLKLTPNRADCLSQTGLAREVAALTGTAAKFPAIETVAVTTDKRRDVVLDEPQACPRYCGRIIDGINPQATTPRWMKQRLERSGLRAISAVVDVTNYVMLEIGQPLHAFDNAQLNGAVHVRLPRAGETLKLLNEQTVEPDAATLLICDEVNPLALAGVMGGLASSVTDSTTELFLESAFFSPTAIAGRTRALGFASDAAFRFERGVDFAVTRQAMERATQLILEICGGRAGPITEAAAALPQRQAIALRPARVQRMLGIPLDAGRTETLLRGLGLACAKDGDDFLVTPPSFRFDLAIEEDLIEELARLHGYDNIPANTPRAALTLLPSAEEKRTPMQLRHLLAGRDYQEVINFSFVDAQWETDFCASANPITLANPIASQMSVMRSSLVGGLVANLSLNLKRRIERVRLFEIGCCFLRGERDEQVAGFHQPMRLGGLCAGPAASEQWGIVKRNVDFFDVKADVEALLAPRTARFEKSSHPALHPGRTATIRVDGEIAGIIGELHPQWVQKYEMGAAPVVFELELCALTQFPLPQFREPSRFPAVVRDLALVVDEELAVQALLDGLWMAAPKLVQDIQLFDVYRGKGLTPGKKSLAFRVVMQDTEKTLSDVEVEAGLAKMIQSVAEKFAATLRV